MHTDATPYQCGVCHAKFKEKGSVDRHIINVHEGKGNIYEGNRKHECEHCRKSFYVMYSLIAYETPLCVCVVNFGASLSVIMITCAHLYLISSNLCCALLCSYALVCGNLSDRLKSACS